ncbi:hypothetical protein [Planosporangium thailandense]|uniref:hypothetical protein n=1 Tax=Planosporangium thailandense TaxID=765197 RepID=UPI00197B1C27|nr:hypothetical protein [Planosporangium thailandense]
MPEYQRRPTPPRVRSRPRRWLVAVLGAGTAALLVTAGTLAFAADDNAANPNCDLVVPPNPLSAQGLATPYLLVANNPRRGACHEGNTAQAAFVQGTILDPATGRLSVYNPLVIDAGQVPAVAPVVPRLPPNAVVGLWFGFNGTNLTLRDANGSLAAGRCVNGLGDSIFGQFAYCNAPAFFQAANSAINAGMLTVPPLGTAKDGNPCPTTRDFSVVDQDQSDNVTSTYLIAGNSAAQNTAANRARLRGVAKVQVNGSDNLLVDAFIDRALGCTPFQAPDLADNGAMTTSLALNELQAAADQGGQVALVPPTNPMVMVGRRVSIDKTNLYRLGVDQPPIDLNQLGVNADQKGARANRVAADVAGALGQQYCQNMVDIQSQRVQLDRNIDSQVTSPDRAAATNLFTFLAQRLNKSFTQLGCQRLLRTRNPVKVVTRRKIAVDAVFAQPVPPLPATGAAGNRGRNNAGPAGGTGTAPPPDIRPNPNLAGDGSLPQPTKY